MAKRRKQEEFPEIVFVTVTDKDPWMLKSEYDSLSPESKLVAELKGVQFLNKPFLSELSKKTRIRPEDL